MYHQTEIRVLYKNAAILMKTSTSELKKRDRDKQPHMYAKPCVYAKNVTCRGGARPSPPHGHRSGSAVKHLQVTFREYTETGTANKNTQVPQ